MLGLDEAGGKGGDLIFVQLNVISSSLHTAGRRLARRFYDSVARGGRFFRRVHRLPRRRCLGFSAGIGQKPARQSARKAARNAAARSGSRQIAGCARRSLFGRGLMLFACFMLNNGSRSRSSGRLAAIFRQRFTGKNDLILGDTGYGRSRVARGLRTTIVVTARRSAAIVIPAGLAALWRRIFRGRQIARARATLRASAAMASATASPTAAAATVSATVTTAAIILSRAVVTAAGRVVLRWIVMGREVLRRGSVGIGLAFFRCFGMLLFHRS